MNDIADFLRARYTEARENAETIHDLDCGEIAYDGPCTCGQPQALIADLDAKLAIVDEHPGDGIYVYTDDGTPACGMCGDGTSRWPCRTLRLLARPFAGHPDYEAGKWAV